MIYPRRIKHNRRRQEQQSPLYPRYIPHRFHEVRPNIILLGHQHHVHDAEDERRYSADDGEDETVDEGFLFAGLHLARSLFDRGWVVDGDREAGRIDRGEGGHDGSYRK
jgi:hypothetical protein